MVLRGGVKDALRAALRGEAVVEGGSRSAVVRC